MNTATQYQHLAPNPKSSYKQLFVKGTRIPARALYGWSVGEDAMTPEELAADFHVPLEAVLESIVYCESNPPELLEDYAQTERIMEALGMNEPDYKYHGKPKRLTPQEMAALYNP